MNSNGIYAVGKMSCTIMALAKTIITQYTSVIHLRTVRQHPEGLLTKKELHRLTFL